METAGVSNATVAAPAGRAGAPQPWWTTLSPRAVLFYPFTGPGPALWAAVALAAAVPWTTGLGWLASVWVMARVVESTARGERRMPPLPKGPRLREEAALFLRALAVVLALLLPLWAVFGAALVRRSDPDVPGPELVMALGLFGTLVTAALVLPALVLLGRGASVSMALNRAILFHELRRRMRAVVFLALFLLYLGGLAGAMLTGALGELGPAGAALARAFTYGLQVLVAFVTGIAAMPPEEKEEPLPAGWTVERS